MDIGVVTLLLLAGIVFLSSIIQSVIGFGLALFATPLLLQMGISLGHKISKTTLRRIAYIILLGIAVTSII